MAVQRLHVLCVCHLHCSDLPTTQHILMLLHFLFSIFFLSKSTWMYERQETQRVSSASGSNCKSSLTTRSSSFESSTFNIKAQYSIILGLLICLSLENNNCHLLSISYGTVFNITYFQTHKTCVLFSPIHRREN